MTILERKKQQDQILEDTVTLTVMVQRTKSGEYTAVCDEYPAANEFVWPTIGEAVEELFWDKVEDIMKERNKSKR